jgi:hypothetical protein
MAGYPDYQYDVDFQEDEEWQVYFELYPSKRQIHSMGNRHLMTSHRTEKSNIPSYLKIKPAEKLPERGQKTGFYFEK